MDYKELLIKYMALIISEEGMTYLNRDSANFWLSEGEIEELKRLKFDADRFGDLKGIKMRLNHE